MGKIEDNYFGMTERRVPIGHKFLMDFTTLVLNIH